MYSSSRQNPLQYAILNVIIVYYSIGVFKPPPNGHQQKNSHIKMLLVTTRHHNIVVFITRQQWKNVNDTIAY